MASSWKVTRGIKSNRVKKDRRAGRKIETRRRESYDPSPQRAKRQRSDGVEAWTTISVSLRVDDLLVIDARADEVGISRSRYLTDAGMILAGRLPRELEQLGRPRVGKV